MTGRRLAVVGPGKQRHPSLPIEMHPVCVPYPVGPSPSRESGDSSSIARPSDTGWSATGRSVESVAARLKE